jgi:Ni/Co efflux regulator RcnB
MRKSIVAALMAATALIPTAAFAQRGERNGNFGQRGEGRQTAQPAPTQQAAPTRPRFESRQQATPQARSDRGQWRGNGGGQWRGNGGIGAGQAQAVQPVQQAAPRAQFDAGQRAPGANRGRFDGNRPDRANSLAGSATRTDRVRFPNGNSVAVTRGNQDGRGRQGGRDWRGNGGNDRGNWGNAGRNGDRGNWNRNWRQDNRYDWNQRRQYNRNAYHLPRYYAPSGWDDGYRRFNVGFTLSTILFNQNYWIDDADYYGLPEAYGPYRWVRYYNDALLVDIDSGEVVDTVYDIFW